ncbi:EBP domain protein [Aspergillus sclerotialis]|uniref:EBP domain protein n=1 Tax=Aspergillus sclerotialis TaxID=2070753 RepID=A0A3A2ZME9_9EURO|nr:EBP domain protein [Aspergillus sclerotialis]
MATHPYYPLDAQIPGYSPNESPLLTILATAAAASAALLGITLAISFLRPNLSKADRFAILWFVLSGSLHCFFEGYFILNHGHMGGAQDILGQLWKEYALSDSRYLTSDTLVLCMESITVVSRTLTK